LVVYNVLVAKNIMWLAGH